MTTRLWILLPLLAGLAAGEPTDEQAQAAVAVVRKTEATRIALAARRIGAIPIHAPFLDVAVHVEQAPGIARRSADLQRDGCDFPVLFLIAMERLHYRWPVACGYRLFNTKCRSQVPR